MLVITSLIIPIITYLLEIWPRYFKKNFGVDVWTRLLEADHIRKNSHKIPKEKLTDQFIIEGHFDYPPIFPLLLSYIPKKTLVKIDGFIAPLFDALHVLLIFYAAYYISNNILLAVLAQLLYMLTPMVVLENSYLTPRSFGYLNFSLAVLPLVLYFHTGNLPFLILGYIFATAIFLTHRFATQSYFFISIFFLFALNSALFLQVFILGFASAILLTKGYYLRVLKGHLSNIYFWVVNLDFRFAHQIKGLEKKNVKSDLVQKIYSFLTVFSPVALFGLNPWAASAFILLGLQYFSQLTLTPLQLTFTLWILFFYFLGVVVLKTKQLMPIGEGQRYLEMATVPSTILGAFTILYLLDTDYRHILLPLLILTLLTLAVFIIFVQIKGVLKDTNRSLTPDIQKAFNYINKQKKKMRIICIPHQNTTLTIYHTNASVLVNADNPGLLKLTHVYPVLKSDLKKLKKEYSLTHLLLRTNYASISDLNIKKSKIEFKSGNICLVKL